MEHIDSLAPADQSATVQPYFSPQPQPVASLEDAFAEWKASCVSDEIVHSNVTVIHGEEVIERLNLSEKLGDKTGTYVTTGGARILSAYDSVIEGGGWFVTGLDPETGYQSRMEWGKLKPTSPRPRSKRAGIQKYEQPNDQPARAVFLDIPSKPDYWQSVEANPGIDLYLFEGEKKAGCGLTLGYASVAVSGIWNATKKNKWGVHEIIPDLKRFAQKGRRVIYVYDSEGVPRKDATVYGAIKTTGRAFQKEGCEVCWVHWNPELGKGFDDVCAAHGEDKAHEILSSPRRLKSYEEQLFSVTKSAEQHVFENFFEGGKGDWAVINQGFYRYTGAGYWQHIEDADMEKTLSHYMMKCYRPQGKERVPNYNVATDRTLKSAFSFCRKALSVGGRRDSSFHLRCFNNGTLNMETGKIEPHKKEDYLTSRIDADFVWGRVCPATFENFIASSFGAENLPLVRAAISMYLDPTAPWGFFLYVLGMSGGGKGTFIRFIQSLFDPDNVRSGNSFSDIATPEGRHQYLKNTAVYAFPDLGGYVQGVRAFYELVDNGSLAGRALYSSTTYQSQFNTRFILASVDPLAIENSGDGWERRAIVLPVRNRTGEKDVMLEKRLGLCKSDVISWALSMPKDERNHILLNSASVSESAAEAKRAVTMTGDSVRQFIDLCLRPVSGGDIGASLADIHTWYREFSKAFGYADMGQSKLGARIQSIIPSAYQKRHKMKAGEPGYQANTWIPAQYKIVAIPGLFEDSESGGTFIHKNKTAEGGLEAFSQGIDYEIKEALMNCSSMDAYNKIVNKYKESVGRVWHSLLPGEHQNRIAALASPPKPEPTQEITEEDIQCGVDDLTMAADSGSTESLEVFEAYPTELKEAVWARVPLDIRSKIMTLRNLKTLEKIEASYGEKWPSQEAQDFARLPREKRDKMLSNAPESTRKKVLAIVDSCNGVKDF